MQGLILLSKPKGITSFSAVSKIKWLAQEKRVGHTGTLDPLATGVLPVFLGRATALSGILLDADKCYTATVKLGVVTDTSDITGEVISETAVNVSRADLEEILKKFRGKISQVPPIYSALKKDGVRLYELARQGKTVEIEPREVEIKRLDLLEFDGDTFKIEVECSKGTYVRTLCHDIGQALGCGGCMSSLRRTMAAGFTLADAVTLEDMQAQGEALLQPVDSLFADAPAYHIHHAKVEALCRNGNAFSVTLPSSTYRTYSKQGEFLMLAKVEEGVMSTIKSFFAV